VSRVPGAIGNARTVPANKLRAPLKKVFAKLKAAGVPKSRWPSNDQLILLLPRWVDWARVDEWVAKKAAAPTTGIRLPKRR
jgi:hypothetical protein